MIAVVEAAQVADVDCKRRHSPAMAKENPSSDATEESRGGATREEGCTAREEENWTADAVKFKDVCGGCSIEEEKLRGYEKSMFNLF